MKQLTDFKEIKTLLNQYEELIISKDNKNNLIIMSMEEYKKKELEDSLLKAEDDIKKGRTINAREVFRELKEQQKI